jgi:hypothetical protein
MEEEKKMKKKKKRSEERTVERVLVLRQSVHPKYQFVD